MATALSGLANATVTFTLPAAGTTTDAATGNVIANTTTSAVSAFLKAEIQEYTRYPGVDVSETIFRGYCVDAVDAAVEEGTEASVVFGGEAAVTCEVVSARRPYGSTGLIGATLDTALGVPVVLRSTAQR